PVVAPVTTAPHINSVSPNPVTGSSNAQPVTINGTGFRSEERRVGTWTSGSKTLTPAEVSFINSGQVQMTINTSTTADNWTVKITNPDNQASNVFGFPVVAPVTTAPHINSVNPNPVTGSSSAQPVTINGTGF